MHFDVSKLVRSPGCDHGHDEESRNGRDIKIDILEAYIWTSEWFRVKSAFYWSTGGLPEPPPGVNGVGERSRNSKFSYVSPRSIYGETINEGKESASTYPCG